MATDPQSSHSSQVVICSLAVAAVVLAGTVLTPLASSNPSREPSPLVAAYEDTSENRERHDDLFREYVTRDGNLVLTRLRVDLWSSADVPRSDELQELQELTLDSPTLARLSHWFDRIDRPLQHLETLSIRLRSNEDETARVAELMSDILVTISQKAPAIASLKLVSLPKSGEPNGCRAPRVGDLFPRLKHLTSIGFDCRDRVRTMIGRADLESLAIRHETIRGQGRHDYTVRAFSADDLNTISKLDHLQRLSLIYCFPSASSLSDVLRTTELKELNLCCKEVDSLAGFESLEILRIGFAAIHRSAMEQFPSLEKLHSLDLAFCHPVLEEGAPPMLFQPPPSLERLTLSHDRAFAGIMPIVLKTVLHDVELLVSVEKLNRNDLALLKTVHYLEVVCPHDREVIEGITHLDQLQSLDCCLWDASPELLTHLFCMKSLRKLNLRVGEVRDIEAALSDSMLQQIEAAMPQNLEEIYIEVFRDDLRAESLCRLFSSFPSLQTAAIQGVLLNGDDLIPLRSCRDLRTLELIDCLFEEGVEEELGRLPYIENLCIDDCWSQREWAFNGRRRLHLEQLDLIGEAPFDVNYVTAERFLIGQRWSKWDRPSEWLLEEDLE